MLLDSVAFLWWVTDDASLSDASIEAVEDPTRTVYLSAVSIWEIALKHGLGKLSLPESPATLIPRLRKAHGIEELPLTGAATLQLTKLPPLHRDPFDRMLVCQAIEHGLTVVTPDSAIQAYPIRTLHAAGVEKGERLAARVSVYPAARNRRRQPSG